MAEHIFIDQGDFRTIGDMDMAKAIAECLVREYPGHPWAVHVDQEQNVATIQNFYLSNRYGMLLHLRGLKGDNAMPALLAKAKELTGQFLERYDLPRGAYREGDYGQAKHKLVTP